VSLLNVPRRYRGLPSASFDPRRRNVRGLSLLPVEFVTDVLRMRIDVCVGLWSVDASVSVTPPLSILEGTDNGDGRCDLLLDTVGDGELSVLESIAAAVGLSCSRSVTCIGGR